MLTKHTCTQHDVFMHSAINLFFLSHSSFSCPLKVKTCFAKSPQECFNTNILPQDVCVQQVAQLVHREGDGVDHFKQKFQLIGRHPSTKGAQLVQVNNFPTTMSLEGYT